MPRPGSYGTGTGRRTAGNIAYVTHAPRLMRPVMRSRYSGSVHDENYKKLFSFPRMVEDLLRSLLPGAWPDEIDFSTLQKLSAEYVSDKLRKRRGDTVWRVRLHRGWLHVLVLLEFQSTGDPDMALRILEYTAMLYRELRRNKALYQDGKRPPVLPVVLYNGAARWKAAVEVRELISPVGPSLAPYQPSQRYLVLDERHVGDDALPRGNLMAAVIGLEQSRSPADLVRVVDVLRERLRDPRDDELRRAFIEWVRWMAERLTPGDTKLPPMRTLEDVRMTLIERVSQWPKQWFQEGLEQGLEQGLERGIEHERALLCRMASSRFGSAAAEHLSVSLARITDPDRLADVGDWLVHCDTGEEFLARVGPPADEQDRCDG